MRKTLCRLHLFDNAPSKGRQKKQSTKTNKQPEAYISNGQYEEPLEQRKARIVPLGEHIRKQPSLERKFVSLVIAT